jgi:hypothetical protein
MNIISDLYFLASEKNIFCRRSNCNNVKHKKIKMKDEKLKTMEGFNLIKIISNFFEKITNA